MERKGRRCHRRRAKQRGVWKKGRGQGTLGTIRRVLHKGFHM